MQKKILLIAVYFTFTGACVNAQNKEQLPPTPPDAPQAPVEHLLTAPPPPPLPPIPPPPLPPDPIAFVSPVIVNNNGYDISVEKIKGTGMIFLEKDGVKQKIKLSTWNANRKFYEKKYGQLPPPPPAPALPGKDKDDPYKIIPDTQ